jgi:hypothetical protein
MEQFFGSCFHEVADLKVTAIKTKKTGKPLLLILIPKFL